MINPFTVFVVLFMLFSLLGLIEKAHARRQRRQRLLIPPPAHRPGCMGSAQPTFITRRIP